MSFSNKRARRGWRVVVVACALAMASGADAQDSAEAIPEGGAADAEQAPARDPAEEAPEPSESDDGPTIVLAPGEPEPEAPQAGEYGDDDIGVDPLRGMQQARFERAAKTSVGGYGELHLNIIKPEADPAFARLDLHRLVLFIAHNFNDRFRFYVELELEHAFVAQPGASQYPVSSASSRRSSIGDSSKAPAKRFTFAAASSSCRWASSTNGMSLRFSMASSVPQSTA